LDVERGERASEPVLDWSRDGVGYSVDVPASTGDRYLVVAEGWDPRWRAELDGKDLGAPEELNGFALGWRVPEDAAGEVTVSFAPQRGYLAALVASLVAVAACLAAVVAGVVLRRRSRRQDGAPEEVPHE
jgi:arabinofuranan 3-O-arabinosyltransferase